MACGHGNLLTLGCCTSWHQLAPAGPRWVKQPVKTLMLYSARYKGSLPFSTCTQEATIVSCPSVIRPCDPLYHMTIEVCVYPLSSHVLCAISKPKFRLMFSGNVTIATANDTDHHCKVVHQILY